MATMPARTPDGQAQSIQVQPDAGWFTEAAGQAVLASEAQLIREALADTRGLAWLWLGPCIQALPTPAPARAGLQLVAATDGQWAGQVRCGLPLPLASESIGQVVVQHPEGRGDALDGLLEECTRVLVPGGRLLAFMLNPLAPYRWQWRGSGQQALEPLALRRRLRRAGLTPAPLSQGLGPRWRVAADSALQSGAGLRAAYLLQAEKRRLPLTPVRERRALQLEGVGAG